MIITTISLFIIDPNITSPLNSFWYVLATVTSLGYGDITPTSTVGKLIGIIFIIVGYILFGILIGAISSIYQVKFTKENKKEEDSIPELLKNQNNEIKSLKKEIEELKEIIKND